MNHKTMKNLSPWSRRKFCQDLLRLITVAGVPLHFRNDVLAQAVGEANAEDILTAEGFFNIDKTRYFIEVNLRDQWDFGNAFIAPGLANDKNLVRGTGSREAALFYDESSLVQGPNNLYLTEHSRELYPHLDHIAVMELSELTIGEIHGHEAANAMRSPGRGHDKRGGKLPMYKLENNGLSERANGHYYSSTPTPASIHNFIQTTFNNSLENGIAFKGIGRKHITAYHFAADLAKAELTRYVNPESLLKKFREPSPLVAFDDIESAVQILKHVDRKFLNHFGYTGKAAINQDEQVSNLLKRVDLPLLDLTLSEEEREFWGNGVPDQVSYSRNLNIWEQYAYAFKLIKADRVRSIALEFDYVDFHGNRAEREMVTQARQTAIPLARLINKLKEQGLFEHTLIAIYTTDGSRAPASQSVGNEGKNGFILAGGAVKGGYYGDIRTQGIEDTGHVYSYHRPDAQGLPVATGVINNENRVSGASCWRTVAKALGAQDKFIDRYADVTDHQSLDFMLR